MVSVRPEPRPGLTDAQVEALLGAYALDACDADEALAVEAVLARRPELADEAARLSNAAAWIGASDALEPPPGLLANVLDAARARRSGPTEPAVELYRTVSDALGRAIDELPERAHDTTTPNGLSAHDLVVHMAAQESLLAQFVGTPTLPEVEESDIVARTRDVLPRFAAPELDAAVELWRASVAVNIDWALDNPTGTVEWRSLPLTRDDALVVRAFETWIHTGDLRAAAGAVPEALAPRHLSLMSDLAGRVLPLALALSDRSRPGKTARLVLSGDGGGEWMVAMDGGEPAVSPDVTLTADVVDWCLLAGDRIRSDELQFTSAGDADLADDLVASANALATL